MTRIRKYVVNRLENIAAVFNLIARQLQNAAYTLEYPEHTARINRAVQRAGVGLEKYAPKVRETV